MAFSQQLLVVACGLVLAALICAPPPAAAASTPRPTPSPAPSKDQSVIIGSVGYMDRMLLQETVYKESIPLVVRDADIVYPKKNEAGLTISCIKVIDQRLDGKNGQVKVKHGGLGYKEVLLRFHSQRGHGMHYMVQIWGH